MTSNTIRLINLPLQVPPPGAGNSVTENGCRAVGNSGSSEKPSAGSAPPSATGVAASEMAAARCRSSPVISPACHWPLRDGRHDGSWRSCTLMIGPTTSDANIYSNSSYNRLQMKVIFFGATENEKYRITICRLTLRSVNNC